jgi:ABC-type sugar transport system ATPase subunit
MSTLELQSVVKTFGDVDVIHPINLTAAHGEFVVFVGPSGCGKSTLLRIIAGLEPATSGQILIDGKGVNDVSAAQRGCAMVFQSYALYPHMSVYDNMAFGLENAGIEKSVIRSQVGQAAALLRLDGLLDRKPTQLSGGQRQRVAIGRAIVRDPKLFLFDEPLSNLDAELRVSMRAELRDLHTRLGSTMIYVTHDQVEAMTLADKIVVLRAGRIEQIGSPQTLYEHPINTFVAGFIGSPRMNFIPRSAMQSVPEILAQLPAHAIQIGVRPEH